MTAGDICWRREKSLEKILPFISDKQNENKKRKTVAELCDAISGLAHYVLMNILSVFIFIKVKIWKERHIVYAFSQNIDFLKIYTYNI